MNAIAIAIMGFLILETANVIALYFFPDAKTANSVGVFKAWERSKQDPEVHRFVKYLVNWVAGTKLIFVLLLIVILATAEQQTLVYTGVALIISVSTFFWRLYPLIRQMDGRDQLDPKNYSAVLGWLILAFVLAFLVATLLSRGG